MKQIKFAVVGGSISGLCATIGLKKLGYEVTVFEKSPVLFDDRGAGVMLPQKLIEQLKKQGFLDVAMTSFKINKRLMFVYDINIDHEVFLTDTNVNGAAVYWGDLYNSLMNMSDTSIIRYSSEVTQIEKHNNLISLTINNKDIETFDYVIFADGYNSIGRKAMHPTFKPAYANYILWRGINRALPSQELKNLSSYINNNALHFNLYERGHWIFYAIPNKSNINQREDYIINWVCYEKVLPSNPLLEIDPTLLTHNIPPGNMPTDYIKYLHDELVDKTIPPILRKIIKTTEQPFIQAVCDMQVPHTVADSMGLIGDASAIIRTHSASGATKALEDAISLFNCIKQTPNDIKLALSKWDYEQNIKQEQLFHLGQDIGRLLVTDIPDLKLIRRSEIDTLWHEVIDKYNWYGA